MGLTILSSDEEDLIDYYEYRKFCRVQREYWVHSYLEKSAETRLFLAEKELSQADRKFIAFYRMSKEFAKLSLSRLSLSTLEVYSFTAHHASPVLRLSRLSPGPKY